MGIDTSIQALAALSKAAEVTSGNLANVNTPLFQARRVRLEDGPGGQGVRLFPAAADGPSDPDLAARLANTPPSPAASPTDPSLSGTSNVDIAREMVDLIQTQNAFAANATAVREWDRTLGLVIDLKV